MEQRILYIDVASGASRRETLDEPGVYGPLDVALKVWDGGRRLVFGGGPLAGSIVPGSNRLTFAGYSPAWDGFFSSSMGGAALPFDDVWPNVVVIEGRASVASALLITMNDGDLRVDVRALDPRPIWKGYDGKEGFYALQAYVHEKIWSGVGEPRILATGPAALATTFGAIGSARVKAGKVTPVDTWCGRGGMGSQLARAHGIVAIAYSGNFEDQDLRDLKEADGYFQKKFSKRMMLVDLEKTTKYRFDPKFASGGTLGSNLSSLRELMFSFNYRSIYESDEARERLWEKLVRDHYLKQFNDETIAGKENYNCGEPCPAVCKKMWGDFKKDYEPYMALGPNAGVFDQRAAERLNHRADALGFDAIQVGGIVSALMEALHLGALKPADVGATRLPRFTADGFDAVADSAENAALGAELLEAIVYGEHTVGVAARRGPRALARAIPAIRDLIAYVSNGDGDGAVIPNFYWVPGMYAPMPLMGKYFCYYGYDYHAPREVGRRNAERMVKEIALDNLGMCRFHRGWAEELLADIINEHMKTAVNFTAHHAALSARLAEMAKVRPWESARTRDIIGAYLAKHVREDEKDATCADWARRFREDGEAAARAYWDELWAGAREGLGVEVE
ncbi:MAG: aldehyde ferredoxin oxidoreductase [Deltaproteobacteria bacterium]|nr:aldehyde ferredoxin oxidoreductase [Deltaproteobacteria bacterium]